jgi:two-component system CheB/CheR fusion protein
VLRAFGPALRAPSCELSVGLERSARAFGAAFERLQTLDALRRSDASQRKSLAELEAFYTSLPVAASIHDATGAVRRVSRELSHDAPPNTDAEPLARLYSEELPAWIKRVLRTGEPIHDLLLSVAQGSELRWWSCNLAALRDANGTVFGASAVVHDITQLKRVEANLREADRQKDDFLAILGHELRNPLAAIRNVTELLSRVELQLPVPQLGHLQKILDRQTLQTTKLIDGLLDVARITHGKIELEMAALELVELVRQVVNDRRQQFREHQLEVLLPQSEIWILADRVRLVQILDNLLSNALKFTLPGGRISVAVQLQDGQRHGSICVADDGMGIEPALLPNVFERFRQGRALLPTAPGGVGLGLGLALVKGLTELHGFQLDAHSDGVGRGASFQIDFPTIAAPAQQRRESSIEARALEILLVEDNTDIAETLAELLGSAGHAVQRVSSGEGALLVLRTRRPDIMLCDIGLPGMDGIALAKCVRADPECYGIKLIAMTGYGDAATRRRIEEAGFDRHLVKPVQHETLLSCLSRLFDGVPAISHAV